MEREGEGERETERENERDFAQTHVYFAFHLVTYLHLI